MNHPRVPALLCSAALLLSLPARSAAADPVDERAAIEATCLDYIESWYEGDAARMARALHPELAKRIVETDAATGEPALGTMGASTLVQGVRKGNGKKTPAEKRHKDVTVLDVFQAAASAKIVASDWVDYLHLAKWKGRWVIVNVLWERNGAKH